ncbi:MAG: hypothetical protein IPM01_05660 [Burkholderiaceae bacterium]|nr:hypothetical protein [Burkholderiaceae bacterium]
MEEKPLFRVGAAGLDPRDSRLIEIVFKHSQYNKYEYQLTTSLEHGAVDILIVNSVEPEGLQALALIRSSGRTIPVIAAVPRGSPSSARHAISIDRLTLQLLPILNRVVELELLSPETRPMGLPGSPAPEWQASRSSRRRSRLPPRPSPRRPAGCPPLAQPPPKGRRPPRRCPCPPVLTRSPLTRSPLTRSPLTRSRRTPPRVRRRRRPPVRRMRHAASPGPVRRPLRRVPTRAVRVGLRQPVWPPCPRQRPGPPALPPTCSPFPSTRPTLPSRSGCACWWSTTARRFAAS